MFVCSCTQRHRVSSPWSDSFGLRLCVISVSCCTQRHRVSDCTAVLAASVVGVSGSVLLVHDKLVMSCWQLEWQLEWQLRQLTCLVTVFGDAYSLLGRASNR